MLTPEQINQIRAKSGLQPLQTKDAVNQQSGNYVGKYDHLKVAKSDNGGFLSELVSRAKNVVEDTKNNFQEIGNTYDKNKNLPATALSSTAILPKAIGDSIFEAIKAIVPDSAKESAKQHISQILEHPIIKKDIIDPIMKFAENNPQTARAIQDVTDIASILPQEKAIEVTGKTILKGAEQTGKKLISAGEEVGKTITKTGDKFVTPLKAIRQTGSELIERVPRAIGRLNESASESAILANRLKEATPEVAKAIKSKLDDKFINTIAEADENTRRAYKQVIDIADETPKTIGLKKQPSIVSGELASKQFDIINKQKQNIGKELGNKIKELSKTDKIDMSSGFNKLDDVLSDQGIKLNYTKRGVKLDFSGTKYTPAERTKIQELYSLASEGGTNLSPSDIHGKDQLFSKLQRESAMDGVGKIMVDTAEGNKSLFSVFRDVFSKNLDDVSPEIRDLNTKYRDLSLVTEDIEDSIFRTPNFNITKTADPAEFAKVNLRRIFGEAQSSPVFEAIADKMDSLSRQLGYAEASPKKVAEFAQELRKIYPESVPKTGFSGSVASGAKGIVMNAVESTLKAGAPNLSDQRKALKELIESYLKNK